MAIVGRSRPTLECWSLGEGPVRYREEAETLARQDQRATDVADLIIDCTSGPELLACTAETT